MGTFARCRTRHLRQENDSARVVEAGNGRSMQHRRCDALVSACVSRYVVGPQLLDDFGGAEEFQKGPRAEKTRAEGSSGAELPFAEPFQYGGEIAAQISFAGGGKFDMGGPRKPRGRASSVSAP